MWIENLYEPFEILIRERAVFPVDVHRHTFFELVYIVSGTGRLSAFGREVTYQPGDLFLIRPETAHRFVVETVSRFVFLRFTQQAVADCTGMLAEPFLSAQKEPDPLQLHEDDAGKIQGLFRLIWMEREKTGLSCGDVLRQWSVFALLIVARIWRHGHCPMRECRRREDWSGCSPISSGISASRNGSRRKRFARRSIFRGIIWDAISGGISRRIWPGISPGAVCGRLKTNWPIRRQASRKSPGSTVFPTPAI